jgi:hypothetical protein
VQKRVLVMVLCADSMMNVTLRALTHVYYMYTYIVVLVVRLNVVCDKQPMNMIKMCLFPLYIHVPLQGIE